MIQFTKASIINAMSKPEADFTDMIESATGTFPTIFKNINQELNLNDPSLNNNSFRYWNDDVSNTCNFIRVVIKCTRDQLLQPGWSYRVGTMGTEQLVDGTIVGVETTTTGSNKVLIDKLCLNLDRFFILF